jgi:hypothetical protein
VIVRVAGCAAALALLVSVASCGGRGTSAGSFSSSDPTLNAVWAASVRTASDMLVPGPLHRDALGRPCAIDLATVVVDGTVRDRCPYVGDEAVVGLTLDVSTPHWGVQRRMLAWFADHQHADGSIPASPLFRGHVVLVDYNAYWLEALYNYVLYSGDVGFARRVWPHVLRLLDGYYSSHIRNGLFVNEEGDPDYAYFKRRGDVVAYYNAQLALALELGSRLARWLDRPQDAARWDARQVRLARAFDGAFWDARVGAYRDTTADSGTHPQDAQAFAILAGLATPAQATQALSYLFAHDVRSYGNTVTDSDHWDSAIVGRGVWNRVYPFISYFEVLARYAAGEDDSALELVRREWGYMLRNGPKSTMWETIGPYGGGPTDQKPSWDAGWSSGAAPAVTSFVLGVQPTSPGYATFTVTPHNSDVKWARGAVVTPHGLLEVSWKLVHGRPRVTVSAPPSTRWVNQPAAP